MNKFLTFVTLVFLCLLLSAFEIKIPLTYEQDIAPIIRDNCLTCHIGSDPDGGFTLDTYEKVKYEITNGHLLKRINDRKNPMPQGGLMKKNFRKKIAKWAEQGFPRSDILKENIKKETIIIRAELNPVALEDGFDIFEKLQGHWTGKLNIMGAKYEWFAYDFQPVSDAHLFGIYEGGTMGNIMTSFFVGQINGQKVILARNGGILKNTYRMSYFILDEVKRTGEKTYYRFSDAIGGRDIMWMELEFSKKEMHFKSYTSRFGLNGRPKLHMDFQGKNRYKKDKKIYKNFPSKEVEIDLGEGWPTPEWGSTYNEITSASYIFQSEEKDWDALALKANDPMPREKLKGLSRLKVFLDEHNSNNKNTIIYLSEKSLTDKNGQLLTEYKYLKNELTESILHFPEVKFPQNSFTFDHLHPGKYFLTAVVDRDENQFATEGDMASESFFLEVLPGKETVIQVGW